jgi:hypothetical protein
MGIWLALSGRVRVWIGVALAFVAALAWAYWRGRSDEEDAAFEREVNEYVETRKRIDEADRPDSADDARQWLRDRQSGRDL